MSFPRRSPHLALAHPERIWLFDTRERTLAPVDAVARGTRATIESIGAAPGRTFLPPPPTRRDWIEVAAWFGALLCGCTAVGAALVMALR